MSSPSKIKGFSKRVLRVPVAALILMSTLVLSGCGGGVHGKYTAKNPEGDGKMTVELKGGDKAVITLDLGMDDPMSSEGTYKVDGDKVTVTVDGNPTSFTLKDGKLIGNMLGERIELAKE